MTISHFSKAEYFLVSGLFIAISATALVQFVLIGLIGLALTPIAIILLILGGAHAYDASVSRPRTVLGFILFLAGIIALGFSTGRGSSIGYTIALHQLRPSELLPTVFEWILWLFCCLLSASAVTSGLALRTCWERSRLTFWGIVVFAVPLLGLVGLVLLARIWPVTA
jgi:hypothetical protein